MSTYYDRPAMIVHAGGNGLFPDEAVLNANNAARCEQYARGGFLQADFEARTFLPLGGEFCLVDLAWNVARRDQRPQRCPTAYSPAKHFGKWTGAAVTACEETRLWSKHG